MEKILHSIIIKCFAIFLTIIVHTNYAFSLEAVGNYKYRYLLWDVYEVTLYTSLKNKQNILDDVPKKLYFKYYKDIPASLLVENAELSLKKNPNFEFQKFAKDLQMIHSAYRNVKEGDVYELEYQPDVGTSLSFNGQKLVSVPGAEFASYYFGIWLSDYSFDRNIAKRLLGE